jgi:hypothetical protein
VPRRRIFGSTLLVIHLRYPTEQYVSFAIQGVYASLRNEARVESNIWSTVRLTKELLNMLTLLRVVLAFIAGKAGQLLVHTAVP